MCGCMSDRCRVAVPEVGRIFDILNASQHSNMFLPIRIFVATNLYV